MFFGVLDQHPGKADCLSPLAAGGWDGGLLRFSTAVQSQGDWRAVARLRLIKPQLGESGVPRN